MLWILQISFIIFNLLLAYILHNSEYVGYYGNSRPKPFKMQLFKWVIWGVATLIPFVSIVSFVAVGIYMLCDWTSDHRIKVDNNSIFLKNIKNIGDSRLMVGCVFKYLRYLQD